MTNFEKIKSMSIKEMTQFICVDAGCFTCFYENTNSCIVDEICEQGIKLWLEQEYSYIKEIEQNIYNVFKIPNELL